MQGILLFSSVARHKTLKQLMNYKRSAKTLFFIALENSLDVSFVTPKWRAQIYQANR
jgi:hypothetical protein